MTVPHRVQGMTYTVDNGEPMTAPPPRRSVPLPLLRILLGLALIVAGVWLAGGWHWGMAALGAAVLVAELWPSGTRR